MIDLFSVVPERLLWDHEVSSHNKDIKMVLTAPLSDAQHKEIE